MSSKKSNSSPNKKRYFVKGMHCSTCEILIKQDIKNMDGINNVKVSLSKEQVFIHTQGSNSVPSAETLTELFGELGYSFHEQKVKEKALEKDDVYKVVGVALLFIVLFYLFEKSGVFMSMSLTSQSSLVSYFIFGLAAGVSSCAALVGGLLLSLSRKWNDLYGSNSKQSKKPFLYFNISRILAFALLGGVLGYLGSFFKVSITLAAAVTILISIIMLILGFQMAGVKWFNRFNFNFLGNNKYLDKNSDIQGKYIPLAIGALTFFIPCGFTIIAQTNALNSGGFYLGMMQLTAFALGTLPILALISFTSIKFYSKPNFTKRFSLFSGVLIVFFALYTLNSQLNVLGLKSLSDFSLTRSNNGEVLKAISDNIDYQVLQLEASGFEYYPKQITIKSGIKTKWEIYNSGARGCANAVYARGLYPEVIQLKPGMNSVEFIAPKPGTYKISCSMGMVPPVTVRVQ